jgi:phosphoribosylformylglycinamidine synthase
MWRILLSESQERMLLAVPPDRLEAARRITARHQVRTTVIGRFTGTGSYAVFHRPGLDEAAVVALRCDQLPTERGDEGFDVPYPLLTWEPEQRPVPPPPPPPALAPGWPDRDPAGLAKLLEQVAGDLDVASQAYADGQYDSTVQGNTVHGPHYGTAVRVPASYWAATPVDGLPAAVVFTTAFAPALFDAHPVAALRQMFCHLLGRQALAGVALSDICVCDNFYTPHLAQGAEGWLVAMVDELAALVRRFGTPVISGKDSSAGSTSTDHGLVHVPPAVFLSGVGKVPHTQQLVGEQWTTPGHLLVRIGPATPSPAGTVAARALDLTTDAVDLVDLDGYRAYLDSLPAVRHRLASATVIGPGGTAAALLNGALASGLGADLHPGVGEVASLFAEHRCAALVEIAEPDLPHLPPALQPQPVARLHPTPGLRLGDQDLLTPGVVHAWTHSFPQAIQ